MANLNKVADRIMSLYDNRGKNGDTAEDILHLVKFLIDNSEEYTQHEKAQLEIFNIECYESVS